MFIRERNYMMNFILLLLISTAAADQSFTSFCGTPANFGKGKLVTIYSNTVSIGIHMLKEEGNECTITYEISLRDKSTAAEFCDSQHPFAPVSSEARGEKVICKIRGLFDCGAQEQLIDDRCFMYDIDTKYEDAKTNCRKLSREYQYDLHKIVNTFEQKWIATFYSPYGLMWVSNDRTQLANLDVIEVKGKILHNREGRFVEYSGDEKNDHYAIITRKGSLSRLRAGFISRVTDETIIPALCSRPALPKSDYLVTLGQRYQEAGYFIRSYKDLFGAPRPFTVIRGLHSFTMSSPYEAGTERLHQTCKSFKHGHAATLFDFGDPNDFKKLLKEAGVNLVAVPGRTKSTKPNEVCGARAKEFMDLRKSFNFDIVLPDGTTYEKTAANDTYWKDKHPDKVCADMPRTALAFTQNGLVDIPNIARLFVACTFGIPPKIELGDELKCSRLATFEDGKCMCNETDKDIRVQEYFRREKYDNDYEQGAVCVDCTGNKQFAVALIVDRSQGVGNVYMEYFIWRVKFSLAFFRSVVKLYVIKDNRITTRPTGRGYREMPYLNWRLRDEWFTTSDSAADHRFFHSEPGSGNCIVGQALKAAYDDLLLQQYDNKMILLAMKNDPSDMQLALSVVRDARAAGMEIIVSADNPASYKDIDSRGVASKNSGYNDFTRSATDVSNLMARRYCVKTRDFGTGTVRAQGY